MNDQGTWSTGAPGRWNIVETAHILNELQAGAEQGVSNDTPAPSPTRQEPCRQPRLQWQGGSPFSVPVCNDNRKMTVIANITVAR